ncbi:MAG: biopolymer transporter ExbD [Deltaproteobacteria bacterium]|jgi:biopolymer transport protein ExbD|nr:biopolymer transporter ExbD [Deltaproteobacteria bacterium]
MQNTNTDDDGEGLSSISDINVTPFIDVMLVLLIIFMVTAPLMMGGVKINLPKTTGLTMERPDKPLIISLDLENKVYVDKEIVTDAQRASTFKRLALESESGEVFVRGDGEVKYGKMMELMSELGQAGFARVTLVTNVLPTSGENAAGEAAAGDGSTAPAVTSGDAAATSEGAPSQGATLSQSDSSQTAAPSAQAPAAAVQSASPASEPAPASPPAVTPAPSPAPAAPAADGQ